MACLTDDHILVNSFDLVYDFLKSDIYKNRKYKITSLNCGDFVPNPIKGDIMGDRKIDFEFNQRFPLVRFPVFDKNTLELLGGYILHPSLFYHAGDCFLGPWVGLRGEPCLNSPTYIKQFVFAKDSSFEVRDCNIVHELYRDLVKNPNRKYVEEYDKEIEKLYPLNI